MQVSFKNEIVPLFNSTNGNGAWFNYGNGGETYGPAFACGVCHAGWLLGMDGGMMPRCSARVLLACQTTTGVNPC